MSYIKPDFTPANKTEGTVCHPCMTLEEKKRKGVATYHEEACDRCGKEKFCTTL